MSDTNEPQFAPPPLPPSPGSGQGPAPIPPPAATVTPAARPTNVLAIVSLVFGLGAWVLLPFVGALVAVICGHLGRKEIRRSQGAQGGDGLAIGGLILGYAQLALSVVALIVVVFILVAMAHDSPY